MDWIALIWVIAGIAIILTEVVVTGFVAVFFGLAAVITGLAIALGLPADGPWPFLLFAALSVGLLLALRNRFSEWFTGRTLASGSPPGPDEDFVGRDAHVVDGFGADDQGRGTVSFRGANWSGRADVELEEGMLVVITGRSNLTLIVAPQE